MVTATSIGSVVAGQTGRLARMNVVYDSVDDLTKVASTQLFNVKDPAFNAVGDGTTNDTAAVTAAVVAANGAPVYLPVGRYLLTCTFTTEHLNLYGPGVIVQPKSATAISIKRPFAAPVSVTAPTLVQWGATGTQGSQMLSAMPMTTGIANYSSGDAYFISANEVYPWNASSGGGTTEEQVKAGFLTILGVGMAVSSITNGGPIEGQMVRGGTSLVTGLVQSSITQGGTDVRIVFNNVSGTFTPGETLTVIAGGNVSPITAGTAVGTVGSTWLLKEGKPFEDTYTTSVQIRKVDKAPTCKIDVTIDTDGDMDQFLTSGQRKDAVIIEGQFQVDAKVRVRSGWCRAMTLKSCYRGIYDVRVDGLPNHAGADQGGFGYGIALAGATEGTEGTIHVRNLRHGFSTNVNYTALWSVDGQTSGLDRYREWGTAKHNTVHGFGMDCTNAVFDCHPGAMFTSFIGCRAVATSAAGRTASLYSILFTSRGIGTSFISCHADGGGFNDDGSSSDAGMYHKVLVKGCTVKNSPQYGFSQLYTSAGDGGTGFWAEVSIEDCDFAMDRTTAPYAAQVPILLATSNTKIRNTRVSGFNAAPVYINATSSNGVYELANVIADYSDGASVTPLQIAGTVDLFLDNYGFRLAATPPSALFESVSGGTNIQLLSPPKPFSKVNTPPILLNTSGTAAITDRTKGRLSIQTSDANVTLTPRVGAGSLLWNVALSTDRVVTLPVKSSALWYAINSDETDVARAWAATGAFTLFVKSGTTTIAKLAPGDHCKSKYDAATDAWYVISQATIPTLSSTAVTTGDAGLTVSTRVGSFVSYYFPTTLTADRALNVTAALWQNDRIRVSRPATGAFNLNVQYAGSTLKALAAGQWLELTQVSATIGTAPVVTAFGSL